MVCINFDESAPAVSDRGWDVNITYASFKSQCDLQKARKGSNHNLGHDRARIPLKCCLVLPSSPLLS